jgi:hypothetical protein
MAPWATSTAKEIVRLFGWQTPADAAEKAAYPGSIRGG